MICPSIAYWNVRGLMADDRFRDCNRLIRDHHLDFLCLLETKLQSHPRSTSHNPKSLALFPFKCSYDNFDSSPCGRILLNWNSFILTFNPILTAAQIIHGDAILANDKSFFLSCIYAHNLELDKRELWNSLGLLFDSITKPWIIMGDFNCVLSSKEK